MFLKIEPRCSDDLEKDRVDRLLHFALDYSAFGYLLAVQPGMTAGAMFGYCKTALLSPSADTPNPALSLTWEASLFAVADALSQSVAGLYIHAI